MLFALLLPTACALAAESEVSPALSPEAERATFQLADGLRIELVASEPMVQDPVAMTFDEDGRLWVVEMRGFMPNIDGEGEEEPVGRVSVLEDIDGDGRMDRSRVFAEGLVLPRAIAVVKGGALVAERKPLWFFEDTDGDGRSDRKTLVDPEYGGTGMPEHSGNGLWRGIDNWHYNAKSRTRYRFRDGKWRSDPTEFRGQWGICHDDYGRLFYNYNWSQLHADLVPPNYLSRNPHHTPATGISVGIATNQSIFPIRSTTAVNRGYIPGVLDEDGRIREFTSAGAPLIYRGDALPAEFRGNAFVCEPAGNLIKRNIVVDGDLESSAQPACAEREFLASTDERFRPVFLSDGPDGALYVADMYRGIIQHHAYITPYLRRKSIERDLERPLHLGRIWRIVPADFQRKRLPRLSTARAEELAAVLSDANGWHRDTAQRLLVERRDLSVLGNLRQLALHGTNHLGRIHALWTLEGLGESQPDALLPAVRDPHHRVRAAAIRVIDLLSSRMRGKSGTGLREKLIDELSKLPEAAPLEVRLQAVLTAGNIDSFRRLPFLTGAISQHPENALMRDAVMSGLEGVESACLMRLWIDPAWQEGEDGQAIFIEMLASSIMRSRERKPVIDMLSRLDVPKFGWKERALLEGMTIHSMDRRFQPLKLDAEPAVLGQARDLEDGAVQRRLEKLRSLFEWPGHKPARMARADVRPLTQAEQRRFVQGRQHYLVACAGCHGADGAGLEPLGPPLIDSDWVLGPKEILIQIILHGLEGPITVNGRRYEPPGILAEMPSLAVMDNENIASVLTYIRREWDHAADPVTVTNVSRVRVMTQGRSRPWTEMELRELGEASGALRETEERAK